MYVFNRTNFFPLKEKFHSNEIEIILKNSIIKNLIKDDFQIEDISSLSFVKDQSILFLEKEMDFNALSKKIIIVTDKKSLYQNLKTNKILVSSLSESYNQILNYMYSHEDSHSYQDEFDYKNGSYISKFSNIHESVSIGKNCLIGRGVEIGPNSIIKNNVVIKNTIIGSDVIICDNSTIGGTGFGFAFEKRGALNLNPQIGIVYIDDNCHIGSCCTVDRGKIDITYIGKNSMIDNLVHIAHNVEISENACIAAQTGISGSVKIGSNVTIGGQAGFAGHLKVGDNVVIAARSGVTKNIDDNSMVAGFPAIDINLWKKKVIKERKNGYK